MLSNERITQRLIEMTSKEAPSEKLGPENCEGSRKALVIFLGPSPGGKKVELRRNIKQECIVPLWGQPYKDPLKWS